MQTGFRSNRDKKRLVAEINVVPYVDVTLVLLIIFMITAPIAQQAVQVDLPKTPKVTQKKPQVGEFEKPFVITVNKDGQYSTSENPNIMLSQKDLEALVGETMARVTLNPNTPVFIEGDEQAAYGKVVNLFVLLKANGVDQVSLMTQPESKAK